MQGFARTLTRMGGVGDPQDRYLQLIDDASVQLTELLELLALAARIQGERWEPLVQDADTLEVARDAVERLGEKAAVSGAGIAVTTDRDAMRVALHGLANAALRHGGLERVEVEVDGREIRLGPVTSAGPVVLGDELKDLGAAVGRMALEALGATVGVEAERLVVRVS